MTQNIMDATKPSSYNTLYWLDLSSLFILDQLWIEEALVRHGFGNWCIINSGSPPAIVMGISGKSEQWVHLNTLQDTPLIQRYSGGGTVAVDENTLFISLIFDKTHLSTPAFPEEIMRWSAQWYTPVIDHPDFALRENDYVIGGKKCGGNAQYITKHRFVHHTSWLWDYNPLHMNRLKHPPKEPNYRSNRSHEEFLCTLQPHFPSKEAFFTAFKNHMATQFTIENTPQLPLPTRLSSRRIL